MSGMWYLWLIVFLLFYLTLVNGRRLIYLGIVRKKGVRKVLPNEMIREYVGKVCAISLFNESFGITGKIVAIEENWLKVEEKDTSRIVNGDMIRDIKLMPAKYQK